MTSKERAAKYVDTLRKTLTDMGRLNPADEELFELMEDNLELYYTAIETIKKEGMTINKGTQYEKAHPAVMVQRNCMNNHISLVKEFAVTVKGRRLLEEKVGTASPDSPLAQFLAMAEDE